MCKHRRRSLQERDELRLEMALNQVRSMTRMRALRRASRYLLQNVVRHAKERALRLRGVGGRLLCHPYRPYLGQSHQTLSDPLNRQSRPLADITTKALNRTTIPQISQKQPQSSQSADRVLENPMDIVIRARAQAQAQPVEEEPSGPRSRMVIRQLVMTNFKSYSGRQIVGPFHASFSAVVGPNGSGKSNVIDSLLFVFGFRASKMRQGKISALIHNSAQHSDLDFCEVEVHFQEIIDLPAGKHEVVPDTTMIVSRKAFKNNSSNYYLNGRTTNFTAVTTLLKDKGIDLDHKRFLILQGEVESIAQMKPKAGQRTRRRPARVS